MRFLHAADLHLDSGFDPAAGVPLDEARAASRLALEHLVAAALRERVDLVVLGGDVFDRSRDHEETANFWMEQLDRLHDARVPVVMVAGNHDAESEIFGQVVHPDGVTLLSSLEPTSRVLDHLDVAVVGQGLDEAGFAPDGGPDLAAGFPEADPGLFTIGLLHTTLGGRKGYRSFAPTSAEVLRARGYGYWALGHVHRREVVSTDPWIVYPGNVQGRGMLETGPKGATLVTVDDGRGREVLHARPLEFDVVRWSICDVPIADDVANLDDVLARIEAELFRAMVEAQGEGLVADRRVLARVNLVCPPRLREECARRECELALEARAIADRLGRIRVERVAIVGPSGPADREPLDPAR